LAQWSSRFGCSNAKYGFETFFKVFQIQKFYQTSIFSSFNWCIKLSAIILFHKFDILSLDEEVSFLEAQVFDSIQNKGLKTQNQILQKQFSVVT